MMFRRKKVKSCVFMIFAVVLTVFLITPIRINGMIYSLCSGKIVGKADVQLCFILPYFYNADGLSAVSVEVPDAGISIVKGWGRQAMNKASVDGVTVWMLPVPDFDETGMGVKYLYVSAEKRAFALRTGEDLYVCPAEDAETAREIAAYLGQAVALSE